MTLTNYIVDVELAFGDSRHCILPSESVGIDAVSGPGGQVAMDGGEWGEKGSRSALRSGEGGGRVADLARGAQVHSAAARRSRSGYGAEGDE